MKIIVNFPFSSEQRAHIDSVTQQYGSHQVIHVNDSESARSEAQNADAIIGVLTPELLIEARSLSWAHSFSAGLETIVTPEVAKLPFTLTNMAGKYAVQGGEHFWALLLALSRGVVRSTKDQRWERFDVTSVSGGTLLIIGLGGFGLQTLKRAAGYDMTVLAIDPIRETKPSGVKELKKPSRNNLHDFLSKADAVAVTCPLVSTTYHLIGADELSKMKPSAYLIGISRGGIIDEDALMVALKRGIIAGAGLDVCETEPVPEDSPLWTTPNLVVTPHRAGFSQRRATETLEFAAEQLERFLQGKTLQNVTNKEAGF